MRHLVLLALVALVALPLPARDHWRGPRRMMVEDSFRPYHRGYERRWEADRWERRGHDHRYVRRDERRYERRYDCDDDRVFLRPLPRPLAPPFQGRVELWLH